MARKIEQLLNVIADLKHFSEGNTKTAFNTTDLSELSENDLELITAAATTPFDREKLDDETLNISL